MQLLITPHEPAVFSDLSSAAGTTSSAELISAGQRKIVLAVDQTVQIGAPVRIEWSDYLVLGECIRTNADQRSIIVKIRHILRHSELSILRQKWV